MSKNLQLPFGEIKVFIDNVNIEYTWENVEKDRTCPNLDGRYKIEINFKPDEKHHTISCIIDNILAPVDRDIESGENLECQSFYSKNCKVSIGVEGGIEYLKNGEILDSTYDYNTNYLDNGMEYEILQDTKTCLYTFGIAWLNDYDSENELQTWFGADCTLFKERNISGD